MGLFCENAKLEILAAPLHSRRARLAFLSAVFRAHGTLQIANGARSFVVRLDSEPLFLAVRQLLGALYRNDAFAADRGRIYIGEDYLVRICLDLKIFCQETDADEPSYYAGIHPRLCADSESRTAYLRGVFLCMGSVTITKGYHLELGFLNGFVAADCVKLLADCGFSVACLTRKDKEILYLKDNEAVSDMLAFLGAAKAVMELNDVYAKRATDKLTNRRINCDMANIDKTVAAAQTQIQAIRALEASGILKTLPKKLQEVAHARLTHPEASLNALAELLHISKSGLRHRLDRLMEFKQSTPND